MQAESSEFVSHAERVLLQPGDKLPEIERGNTFKTKDDLLNNMSMVAFAHGFFYSVYERTSLEETGSGKHPASADRIMFICSTSEGSPNLCPWTMTATASSGSEAWTVTAVCKTHLHVVFPLVDVSLQKFLHLSMANKLRSLSFKSNDVEGPFTSDVRDGNRIAMGADGEELDRDSAVRDASRVGQKRSGDAGILLYANLPRKRGRPPKHPKPQPVFGERVLQFDNTFTSPLGSQNNMTAQPRPQTAAKVDPSTPEIRAVATSQASLEELKELSTEFRIRRALSARSLTNPISGDISAAFVASERQALFASKYRELFIIDTRSAFQVSDTEVVGLNIIGIDHEMRSFSACTAFYYSNEPRKPYLWILRQFRSILFPTTRTSGTGQDAANVDEPGVFITDRNDDMLDAIGEVFPDSISRICKTHIYTSLTEYLASKRSYLIEDKIDEFESGILALGSTADKKEYINQLSSLRRAFQGTTLWNEFTKEYMSGWETAWMDLFDAELRTFGMKTTARSEAFSKKLRQSLEAEFTLESDISKLQRVLKVLHEEVFDIPDFIEQDNKLLRYRATLQIHHKLYPVKFRVSQFALLKMTGELRTLEDGDSNTVASTDKGHCTCTLPAQFGLPCYHNLESLDEVNLNMIDKRWNIPAFTDGQLHQQSSTPVNRKRLLANEELSLDNQIVFAPAATKSAGNDLPAPSTAPIPILESTPQSKRRRMPPKSQTQTTSLAQTPLSSSAAMEVVPVSTPAVPVETSSTPAKNAPAPNWPVPQLTAPTPLVPSALVRSAHTDAQTDQSTGEGTVGMLRNQSLQMVFDSPVKKNARACSSCGSTVHDSRICSKRKEIQKLILF